MFSMKSEKKNDDTWLDRKIMKQNHMQKPTFPVKARF